MRASSRIVARCQPDGATRLTTLAGEAPMLLRRGAVRRPTAAATTVGSAGSASFATSDAPFDTAYVDRIWPAADGRPAAQVHMVGGAAGPLGGDELRCLVDLGPGARLDVRGTASSIALPGPNGRESTLEIHARVSEGAALAWSPPPLIAARGARHR
ncbi:MAG: urease accessory protein UreD, partial [Actinocrinis sp.]